MADFLWQKSNQQYLDNLFKQLYEIKLTPVNQLAIHGNTGTFNSLEDKNDFIFVLGHCHFPDKTENESLEDILISFLESKIDMIKSSLFGQYILIIKKNQNIFIFSDCMQVRNIFYSISGEIISSSFSSIENYIDTDINSLDTYKLFEFLALGTMAFPGWLGNGTCHKDIKRLRPYEYIKIGPDKSFSIGKVIFQIDNRKVYDLDYLANELIKNLANAIFQNNLKNKKIGATITGGYDSRLVSAIAAGYYDNLRLRIGVSNDRPRTLMDLKVAQKVAKKCSISLDVYYKNGSMDEDLFFNITAGFTRNDNSSTMRLIDNTHLYAMGLGGMCGSQLFCNAENMDDFMKRRFSPLKHRFTNCDNYIDKLYENLNNEFSNLKTHFVFLDDSEHDLLRMFLLDNSISYGSFIHSAFNIKGIQVEPYLTMPVIELAFKVPDSFQGNKNRLGGTNLVQKKAMLSVSYDMGKIMTFAHFEPMLPLSFRTLPEYCMDYLLHIIYWSKEKTLKKNSQIYKTNFNNKEYISDGWNGMFIRHMKEKYDNEIIIS